MDNLCGKVEKISKIHLFSNGSVTLRFVYCCKDRCILLFLGIIKRGKETITEENTKMHYQIDIDNGSQ